MDQIDFSEFFNTKAEANDFLSRLRAVIDKIFQTDFHLDKAFAEQFGINKSDRLFAVLRENNINTESLNAVKPFLENMQETVAKLPVLSITIAFEPGDKTLKSLSEWFLINLKKQVVFDITVDRRLVAGATINFNGKFSDYSIRPVVERMIKTYASRITTPQNKPTVQQTAPQAAHQRVEDISLGR